MSLSLSIIVPVYNAAPFLKRCIESILIQDYTDFELIIVDDGSTDGSALICDEIADSDNRVTVLHQANSGVNTARLNGVKLTKGDFVMFVDADDMLPDHAISMLMQKEHKEFDIIKGGYSCYLSNDKDFYENNRYIKEFVYTNSISFAESLVEGETMPFLWGGIYKKQLLKECYFQLLSEKKLSIGEDFVLNLLVSKNIKKVKIISYVVYNYFINGSSVMNTKVTSSDYFDRVYSVIKELYQHDNYQYQLKRKRSLVYLHNMFVPEFGFCENRYNSIKEMFKNRSFRKDIEKARGMRYIHFFDYPLLYRLYSKMYCYLFLYLKLKGHKRIIID